MLKGNVGEGRSFRGVVPPRSLRGFTLIELLVVIAIIAILAAILFPVFSQAREKARQAQCTSNLRNISMALAQYNNDYDERVPPLEMWQGWTGCRDLLYAGGDAFRVSIGVSETCDPFQRWAHRIQPYLRNLPIFTDPSGGTAVIGATGPCCGFPAIFPRFGGAWGWRWHPDFIGTRFSYGYNQLLAAHAGNAGSIAKIQRPADILLVSDSAHKDSVPEQVVFWGQIHPAYNVDTFVVPRIIWANICAAGCVANRRIEANTRHHLGSVLSFADGHTKFVQHRSIWTNARQLAGVDQLSPFRLLR